MSNDAARAGPDSTVLTGRVELLAIVTSRRDDAPAGGTEILTAPAVASRFGVARLGGAVRRGAADGASALPGLMID
jgi:hypothetical protein